MRVFFTTSRYSPPSDYLHQYGLGAGSWMSQVIQTPSPPPVHTVIGQGALGEGVIGLRSPSGIMWYLRVSDNGILNVPPPGDVRFLRY